MSIRKRERNGIEGRKNGGDIIQGKEKEQLKTETRPHHIL